MSHSPNFYWIALRCVFTFHAAARHQAKGRVIQACRFIRTLRRPSAAVSLSKVAHVTLTRPRAAKTKLRAHTNNAQCLHLALSHKTNAVVRDRSEPGRVHVRSQLRMHAAFATRTTPSVGSFTRYHSELARSPSRSRSSQKLPRSDNNIEVGRLIQRTKLERAFRCREIYARGTGRRGMCGGGSMLHAMPAVPKL